MRYLIIFCTVCLLGICLCILSSCSDGFDAPANSTEIHLACGNTKGSYMYGGMVSDNIFTISVWHNGNFYYPVNSPKIRIGSKFYKVISVAPDWIVLGRE